MKDSIFLSTPEHASLEFELAGLGSRFMAHAIDLMVIGAVLIVFWLFIILGPLAFLVRYALGSAEVFGSYGIAMMILISFVLLWGYYFLLEGYYQGTTPGKKAMGIRVIREDGLPIGYYEAAVRNFVRAADAFPPPTYFLGGIVMQVDSTGKRLGDMVAGTIVIRESFPQAIESRTGAAWAARVEKGHSRKPLSLPGGDVTVRQMDLIEQYLNRRTSFPLERRQELAQSMAAPLWKIAGLQKPDETSLTGILQRDEKFLQHLLDQANEDGAHATTLQIPKPESSFF